MEYVTGSVERIVSRNEATGYTTACLQLEDGMTTRVIGPLADLSPGDHVSLEGEWTVHRQYGRLLRVTGYRILHSHTQETVPPFLQESWSSGPSEENSTLGSQPITIDLNAQVITLGRDKEVADVAIDALAVSRRHAQITRFQSGVWIKDLNSTNGTFVNGERLTQPHLLVLGDVIALGGEHLTFDGHRLLNRKARSAGFEIVLRDVGRSVLHRDTGQPLSLLRQVNLTINPGEFVALLGPSGAGKSVLMKAISGRERATEGQILYDRESFYERFGSFSTAIGYAPQKDIFHDTLLVADALRYSSKLRLAKDVTPQEIETNIDRVLALVGLTAKKNEVIKRLSGGQQKRVTIALELLSNPKILFLDEVTSPLDPATEKEVMGVFRDLARTGVTIICITHHANSSSLCDQVAFVQDGLLTFYGPPRNFKEHFEVENVEDAYAQIKKRPAEEWCAMYQASETHKKYVLNRAWRTANDGEVPVSSKEPQFGLQEFLQQWGLLVRRYAHTMLMDAKTPAVLIGMSILVAALVCVLVAGIKTVDLQTTPNEWLDFMKKQKIVCFGSIVTALFLALFGSVREIVREQDIYEHEHLVCVKPIAYLTSKIAPLFMIGAIQCLLIVLVVNLFGGIKAGNMAAQYVILVLVSWVGTLTGLAISAGVRDGEKAVMLMIAVVIPQILFSGAFTVLKGFAKFIAGIFCASYWGMQGLMGMVEAKVSTPQIIPATQAEDFAGFWVGAGMVLVHMATTFCIAYWLMVRRDGSGATGRIIAAIKKGLLDRCAKADALQNQPDSSSSLGKSATNFLVLAGGASVLVAGVAGVLCYPHLRKFVSNAEANTNPTPIVSTSNAVHTPPPPQQPTPQPPSPSGTVATPLTVSTSRRPNSFMIQSVQAGSTTDIDNLRVVDLDTGATVYLNTFSLPSDATRGLSLFYWPKGGIDHSDFVLNGSMTRVINGKLRLQTTGFQANGAGGYESHSELEFNGLLPNNFLLEFEATRLQWAGAVNFDVFSRESADAIGTHMQGGAYSKSRVTKTRRGVARMSASGSWFNPYGYISDPESGRWSIEFKKPSGSLLSPHKLGISLKNSTLSFYLDGNLLNSADIGALLESR